MQTGDNVIQNLCRMQGRCVFGGIRSTAYLGESNQGSPFNTYIPMTLVQKQEKAESSLHTCAEVGHRAVLRSWVRRYSCKNLGFLWPVHSSLASSVRLDIVKVDKTQMVELSWEPSDNSICPGC